MFALLTASSCSRARTAPDMRTLSLSRNADIRGSRPVRGVIQDLLAGIIARYSQSLSPMCARPCAHLDRLESLDPARRDTSESVSLVSRSPSKASAASHR